MNVETKIKAKSHFSIIKLDRDGNEIYNGNLTYNKITDYGYQVVYGQNGEVGMFPVSTTNYQVFRYMRIGSGTVSFTSTSTGLTNSLAVVDGNTQTKPAGPSVSSVTEDGVEYVKVTAYYAFPYGSLDLSFTELGIFSGNNNSTMLCGQLVKSDNGLPDQVTVTDEEQLIIKYTMYWPTIRSGTQFGVIQTNDEEYEATVSASGTMVWDSTTVRFPVSTSYVNYDSVVRNQSQTVTKTIYDNRVTRVLKTTLPLSIQTSAVTNIDWKFYNQNSTSYSMVRQAFDPPLPKTNENMIDVELSWTIRWRN